MTKEGAAAVTVAVEGDAWSEAQAWLFGTERWHNIPLLKSLHHELRGQPGRVEGVGAVNQLVVEPSDLQWAFNVFECQFPL